MAKLHITKESEQVLEFTLTCLDNNKLHYCLANALRRIMMSEIPTLAIDQVIIYDNTTNLPNEMVTHRLGLIPLVYDDSTPHNLMEDVEFMVDITCSGGIRNVISQDLVSNDKTRCSLLKDVILTKLFPGQALKLKATINSGIGSDHAKWSPVSGVSFCPDTKVKNKFHFVVESNGTLTPRKIVQTAFEILKKRAANLPEQFDTSVLFKTDIVVDEIVVR